MYILNELLKAGFSWTLENSTQAYNEKHPDRLTPVLKLTLKTPEGVLHERILSLNTPITMDRMIVVLMKDHLRDHPLLRAWLDSRGNVPVAMQPDALECVSEYMHTALRKLADSKQSVITWNGLHHLHPEDHSAMWAAVREYLTQAFNKDKPPLRRDLALGLQEMLVAFFKHRDTVNLQDADGRDVKRNNLDGFALRAMYAACSLTELDEWMWTWLGYVVNDIERESVST